MGEREFIEEISNHNKVRSMIFFILFVSILILGSMFILINWTQMKSDFPFLTSVSNSLEENVKNASFSGMFYFNLIGGLFFIPSPDEVIFYYGLAKGNSIIGIIIATILGYLIAQVFNYVVGMRLSESILNLVSKRKVFKTRRFSNKYGGYGVFLANVLPLPGPLLTFALGITKYNFKRLMLLTFAGKAIKYGILIVFFLWIG